MKDDELVAAILAGDEGAFRELVTRYHSTFVRTARVYVANEAAAEDVAQDAWLAVLKGLARFEGRSSLKTWLLAIVVNRARTTGQRESRSVPVDPRPDPVVAASRFDAGGLWLEPPVPFTERVEDAMADERLVGLVRGAIARLPEAPRAVVTLRDVEGLTTEEVAELLQMTTGNVRVILHRGRARVRAEVEQALAGGVA